MISGSAVAAVREPLREVGATSVDAGGVKTVLDDSDMMMREI